MKSKNTFSAIAIAMGAIIFTACEKEKLATPNLSLRNSISNLTEKQSDTGTGSSYLPSIDTRQYPKFKIVTNPEPNNQYNNGNTSEYRMNTDITMIPKVEIDPDPEPWKTKH